MCFVFVLQELTELHISAILTRLWQPSGQMFQAN